MKPNLNYAIDPAADVTLPVVGSDLRFPVNNLFCVGRNYADHAMEMGGDPNREPPFFFIKPAFSILSDDQDMNYPEFSEDVHHEVEAVVALARGGRSIAVEDAMSLVFGYAVGVDMTRRDLQGQAKAAGRPWEAGKTFVHAAPCGPITPGERTGELSDGRIQLETDGVIKQSGDINQMIWKIPEIISRLSRLFVLQPGDLIFTGTPAGVGPIKPGESIRAFVAGLAPLTFKVSSSKAG